MIRDRTHKIRSFIINDNQRIKFAQYLECDNVAMIEKTSTLLVIIVGLFLRSKTFALSSNESLGDECKDLHEKCMRWAESGECEKNESYMLIHCLESCNVCKSASR